MEHYQNRQSLAGASQRWPEDAWWQAYGDPQLDRLIEEGLKGSPTMALAEARLRRALAMREVAGSALQPQMQGQAKPTLDKQSYNYLFPRNAVPQGWNDYGLVSINFNWEIDFWGKNRAALASAISMQEASAADEAQARLALAASIAGAYGDLARLHALHDTAQAATKVRAKTLELLDKRREHGMETLGAVKQAEARKAAAEEELLALEEQLALQRNRLAALLGAGPERGLGISRPTLSLDRAFPVPERLDLEWLGRRPDIVASRLRVTAAEKNIDRQKAEFYPNVNLAAMIGLQTLGLNKLAHSGSGMGSIGPAISLPIFSGGRLRGQLRGAYADYDEAVGEYNRTVTHALQEVADAAVSQRSVTQQIAKLEQAAAAAAEAHRIIRNRYEGGLSSYLDVLSAEEVLLASLRNLREVQSRSYTLDVALIKSLGGGYRAPTKAAELKEKT